MSADLVKLELGALINVFYPIFIGALTIILFIIFSVIVKNEKWRKGFLILIILLNIAVGLIIRFVDM